MTEAHESYGQFMLLLGVVAVLGIPLRSALRKMALPALVAFIGLGVAISAADQSFGFLTQRLDDGIGLLAQIGLVALLFRVGIESDLGRLAGQMRRAAAIWLPNMIL